MSTDMHVEGFRVGAQQMIVDRRNVDAAFEQLSHGRIDFGFEQDQVAHHHRFAAPRLEGGPAAERQRGFDCDAVDRHLKIGSRKTVTVNLTRDGTGLSQCCIDLLPVDLLSRSGGGNGQRHAASCKHLKSTHG